jgi:hypothetical protein
MSPCLLPLSPEHLALWPHTRLSYDSLLHPYAFVPLFFHPGLFFLFLSSTFPKPHVFGKCLLIFKVSIKILFLHCNLSALHRIGCFIYFPNHRFIFITACTSQYYMCMFFPPYLPTFQNFMKCSKSAFLS